MDIENTTGALQTPDLLRREFFSADRVLIGAGAGLSASAGLSYFDTEAFKKYFPVMVREGFNCQYELVGRRDNEWTPGRKWAYWATHILYVRETVPPLPLYAKLLAALEGRDYFVVTSNADRQFMRAGFPAERLFEYQGSYDYLGCLKRCTGHTWASLPELRKVREHIDPETFECPEEWIPHCPYCGAPADIIFRPETHRQEFQRYADFVNSSVDMRLCIIELGVGFNTPGVIRWPFEQITAQIPGATLFRVNRGYREIISHPGYAKVPELLEGKAFSMQMDCGDVISALVR